MNTKNPLPSQATKAEVRDWYWKLPDRVVRQVIAAAVKNVNKTALIKTSKKSQSLNYKHLEIIYEELGKPKIK